MIWRQLPSRMSFFYLKPTKVFPTPDLCTVLLRKFFFRMFNVVSSLYILGAQPLRPCIARVFSDCLMETTAFFSPSLSFPFVTWPSLFTLIELVMVSADIPVDSNSILWLCGPQTLTLFSAPPSSYTPYSTCQETTMAPSWKCRRSDHFALPPLLPPCLGLSHHCLSLGYRIATKLDFLLLCFPTYSLFSIK